MSLAVEQASPGAAAKPSGDRGAGKSAIGTAGEAPSLTQRPPSAKGTSTPAPSPAPGPERPLPGSKVTQDAPPSAADSIPKAPSAERAPPPSSNGSTPKPPVKPSDETERETKRLLDEEEERRKTRRRKKVPHAICQTMQQVACKEVLAWGLVGSCLQQGDPKWRSQAHKAADG